MGYQPQSQPQLQPSEQSPTSLSPSAQLDLAITLILHNWPVLTLAVQSSWGGPTSSEKRDWFCAAIAELFTDRPETDAIDLEEVLLQVMSDEFDVVVDDGSAADIADRVVELKEEIEKGDLAGVNKMWEAWKQKELRGGGDGNASLGLFRKVEMRDEDQETDEDEDEDDDEHEDGDVAMEDAPAPRPQRERTEPEVDEDGFTKVVGRRKR
ncbi:LOW QUALITY PROTEIN: pre-rRNA-processing protein TSR2 [Coccidioides immitis RMSCC 2394]|uniref:Pre-rRNA-processing protein TSR2 n=1 Tax=Coccidioides immitis RMSCC 2394 TaxID=404692 RepID=A0A0J6Y3W1_COCIT|nr:LOW QUALITY PROTEIN: pre-rRNA-processing protein TSR2 [Coccidioides immitis RMSCC 2394]